MSDILSKLTKEEFKYFTVKSLKKNEIPFREGDFCDSIGIVESGEIEIVSYSYSGKEIVFTTLYPGMMFGNNLAFSSDPYFKGNVVAIKTSKVYIIKKDKILAIFQQNPDFLQEFLKYQSDMGKELNSRIRLLNLLGAEERFLHYLQSKNGIIRYTTITKLSSDLNLQRETLSRLINRLIKEKKIFKDNHIIKIIN